MKTIKLSNYLDRLLNINNIPDDSLNGLQVENRSDVKTVAFAVDVSAESIQRAQRSGAQFLFVHHGLFWGKQVPVTGIYYERLRLCIESDIALYAAHLPLDLHPQLGNNAQLIKIFGWKHATDFGEYHGNVIGKAVHFKKPIAFQDMANLLRTRLNTSPIVWNFGDRNIHHAAIISGGALSMLDQVVKSGIDTLITGEPGHAQYWLAKECKINVLFGGHYQTEIAGVQALLYHIKKYLKLNTIFIDIPTGY